MKLIVGDRVQHKKTGHVGKVKYISAMCEIWGRSVTLYDVHWDTIILVQDPLRQRDEVEGWRQGYEAEELEKI